jgi:hypothetical protein
MMVWRIDVDLEFMALGVSFLIALVGYLITYIQSIRLEQRTQKISRINSQLRDFYGPMYAITSSSKSSFYALVRKTVPDGDKEKFKQNIRANPRSAAAIEYRKWMEEVISSYHYDKKLTFIGIHATKYTLLGFNCRTR